VEGKSKNWGEAGVYLEGVRVHPRGKTSAEDHANNARATIKKRDGGTETGGNNVQF